MRQAEIVFSIPGRMRIFIKDLYKDEGNACGISGAVEELNGVISVRSNARTGNMLVCYRPGLIAAKEILDRIIAFDGAPTPENPGESLFKSVLKAFSPCILTKRRHPSAVSKHGYGLSRRFLKGAAIVGGIAYLINFILRRFVSILIFAYPAIFFVIPAAALHYGAKRTRSRSIFLKNHDSLDRLRDTEKVYLRDSIIIKADDPKLTDFVFGVRENGITDIAIITARDDDFIDKKASELGIEKIYRLNDRITVLDFFHQNTLIVTAEEFADWIHELPMGLTLLVFDKDSREMKQFDIRVENGELDKIPWLVGLSRYCKEIIVRGQNSAAAVSSLGILLASLGYLSPAGAVTVYGVNTAWHFFSVKNRMLSYEKEGG